MRERRRKKERTVQRSPEKEERKMKMFVENKAVEEASKAALTCVALIVGPCMQGVITKIPLKTELWKLKIAKICFQFP